MGSPSTVDGRGARCIQRQLQRSRRRELSVLNRSKIDSTSDLHLIVVGWYFFRPERAPRFPGGRLISVKAPGASVSLHQPQAPRAATPRMSRRPLAGSDATMWHSHTEVSDLYPCFDENFLNPPCVHLYTRVPKQSFCDCLCFFDLWFAGRVRRRNTEECWREWMPLQKKKDEDRVSWCVIRIFFVWHFRYR